MLFLGDVIDPLALFPLEVECLCELLVNVEAGEDDEFEVKDELTDDVLDVGPDVEFELLPLTLLVGLNMLGADLLVDGMEEGDACVGRA